jgi:hypothetical protein
VCWNSSPERSIYEVTAPDCDQIAPDPRQGLCDKLRLRAYIQLSRDANEGS